MKTLPKRWTRLVIENIANSRFRSSTVEYFLKFKQFRGSIITQITLFEWDHKKKKQKHVSETSVHRCAKSEGLRFDSSWGLRIFSLFHVRDKTRKKFPYASGVIQLRFLPKCSICYNELENAKQSKGLKLTASESLIRTVIKIIQRRK